MIARARCSPSTSTSGSRGAGFITLAVTLTRYADRADQIVAATIYPAICAVQGRTGGSRSCS